MRDVRRMIRWFEKPPGDTFVGESEMCGITLAELQHLFSAPESDPMYECWPVRAEHVAGLAHYLAVAIELDRYDYFVEADAID